MHESTQESKELIGTVVSQSSLWNHILLIPSSLHQQHNSIKTCTESLKLSNKSTAVWITEIIQTVQMIFLFQMDSGTLLRNSSSNKSGILLTKLIDGPTKTKHNCIFKTLKDAAY